MMKNIMKYSLIFIMILHSCSEEKQDKQPVPFIEPSAYLALGDSYTIGQSVEEKDRFPVLLTQDLNKRGNPYKPPKIIAKTGWTTDELKDAIIEENIDNNYDLVTLLIGVNNQYRGRDVEEFRVQFTELLDMAITFAKGQKENVIVISIPDWGVSPFAENRDREKISKEIDLYNKVKEEVTIARNVVFVNITDVSRSGLGKPEFFANDGLHFSGKMHQLWVDEIFTQYYNKAGSNE